MTAKYMTCRVRAISARTTMTGYDSSLGAPKPYSAEGYVIKTSIPEARRRAARTAQSASAIHSSRVFFVETHNPELGWVNKDIWYKGAQYEIAGNTIPSFPLRQLIPLIIGEPQ